VFAKQRRNVPFSLQKFVPGLSTAAPPLAGIFHMRRRRFLLWDFLGSVLWAGAFSAPRLYFQRTDRSHRGTCCVSRQRIDGADCGSAGRLHHLEIHWPAKIPCANCASAASRPEELKEKIDAREELVIVDLRHSLDFEADPETIPGAFHMDVKDLEERSDRLPPDARSSSTVLDQTKPPAPVWRCSSENKGLREFGRWKAGWTAGAKQGSVYRRPCLKNRNKIPRLRKSKRKVSLKQLAG